jgi:hypothetical protein
MKWRMIPDEVLVSREGCVPARLCLKDHVWPGLLGVHGNLRVPVKRRRALLAGKPTKE